MSRRCSVCDRDDIAKIEESLHSGSTVQQVAREFQLSADAVYRHKRGHSQHSANHSPTARNRAAEMRRFARARRLVDRDARRLIAEEDEEVTELVAATRDLRERQLGMLTGAEVDQDRPGFSAISREVRGSVRLEAELSGEIRNKVEINAFVTAQADADPLSDKDRAELAQIWHAWLVKKATENRDETVVIDTDVVREAIAQGSELIAEGQARASVPESAEEPDPVAEEPSE